MITIKTIASSSGGNCYRIDVNGNSPLLLEAGIPIRKIREGLGFQLAGIDACLISHEHGDHAKAAKDIMAAGIDIYTSTGTAEALGINKHYRCSQVKPRHSFRAGDWRAIPFEIVHDAAEPLGFYLIAPGDGETLLFLTDTAYCRIRVPVINYLMLECNYSDELLRRNVVTGEISISRCRRILHNHFGLDNVLDFLRANDLTRLREIHLLHLSNKNADAAEIKRRVSGVAGVPVYVEEE